MQSYFQPVKIENSSVIFQVLSELENDTAMVMLSQARTEIEEISKRLIQVSNVPSKVNGITVQKEHLNMIFTEGFGSGLGYIQQLYIRNDIHGKIFLSSTIKIT